MKDIPVNLQGHRCTVVESPTVKLREDGSGATNWEGVRQFVVALFIRQLPMAGRRTPKGEEVRVTLETDPGEGFAEGEWVELIDPRVSPWEMRDERGRVSSGLSFKAMGMKLAGVAASTSA